MQVSYNWLKELVNVDVTSHDLSEKMSTSGIEVEGVETRSEGLSLVKMSQHKSFVARLILKRGSKSSLPCQVPGFQVITKSKKGKSVALKVLV